VRRFALELVGAYLISRGRDPRAGADRPRRAWAL